jgi:tRNA 2-thiouridine synthesizing protein A
MNSDKTLDVKGMACPMPIVKTKKEIDKLNVGDILEVHATDKGAIKDFPAWARTAGHEMLEHKEEDGVLKFYFKKSK